MQRLRREDGFMVQAACAFERAHPCEAIYPAVSEFAVQLPSEVTTQSAPNTRLNMPLLSRAKNEAWSLADWRVTSTTDVDFPYRRYRAELEDNYRKAYGLIGL